jgi:hypothetical protein
MRSLAEDTREPKTRRMMLSIAEGYDKRATRARERSEPTTMIAVKVPVASRGQAYERSSALQ